MLDQVLEDHPVLDVLGVLRTFFPSVLAGLVQLAIALVGTEVL